MSISLDFTGFPGTYPIFLIMYNIYTTSVYMKHQGIRYFD